MGTRKLEERGAPIYAAAERHHVKALVVLKVTHKSDTRCGEDDVIVKEDMRQSSRNNRLELAPHGLYVVINHHPSNMAGSLGMAGVGQGQYGMALTRPLKRPRVNEGLKPPAQTWDCALISVVPLFISTQDERREGKLIVEQQLLHEHSLPAQRRRCMTIREGTGCHMLSCGIGGSRQLPEWRDVAHGSTQTLAAWPAADEWQAPLCLLANMAMPALRRWRSFNVKPRSSISNGCLCTGHCCRLLTSSISSFQPTTQSCHAVGVSHRAGSS